MVNALNEAFSVMTVGMLTVFFILALVVFIGKSIIFLVNKITPNKAKTDDATKGNDPRIIAAMVAAVDIVSQGKGKITTSKRIN